MFYTHTFQAQIEGLLFSPRSYPYGVTTGNVARSVLNDTVETKTQTNCPSYSTCNHSLLAVRPRTASTVS